LCHTDYIYNFIVSLYFKHNGMSSTKVKCKVFTATSVLLHQISRKTNRIFLSTVSFRIVIPVTSEVLLYNINPTLRSRRRTLTGLTSLAMQRFSFLRARTEPRRIKLLLYSPATRNIQVCCTLVPSHSRTDILHTLVTYQLNNDLSVSGRI
jgi:hypothetical protein